MKAASHVTRRLGRATRSAASVTSTLSYASNAPTLCDSLYTKSMEVVDNFPDQFYTCSDASCEQVSYASAHESYAGYVQEMTKVTRKLSRGYNKAVGIKSRRMLRLRRNANKEKRALMSSLSLVPNETHRCR